MEAGRLYQSLRGRLYRRLPVLAVPLGLATAIYLNEYAGRGNKLVNLI